MKTLLCVVLVFLCAVTGMAQRITLPALYKGDDITLGTKPAQIRSLHLSDTMTTNSNLTPMTKRFLTEFCMSRGLFDFVKVAAERTGVQDVKLAFETTNEYTSSTFIIERAIAKGTEHEEMVQARDTSYLLMYKAGVVSEFDQVEKKFAKNKGAEKAKYELTDNNNFTGISFYRITEIGYDQTMISSKIVAVLGTPLKEAIALFPNPAVSQATVSIYSKIASAGWLQVLNHQGTVVKESAVNIITGSNNFLLPVSGFASGSYFIRVIRKDSPVPLQSQIIKM